MRCTLRFPQVAFTDFLRDCGQHMFGGDSLVGSVLWVYHFGDFLDPLHSAYGTWHRAVVAGFDGVTGAHMVRLQLLLGQRS